MVFTGRARSHLPASWRTWGRWYGMAEGRGFEAPRRVRRRRGGSRRDRAGD
jgi:hypothetical protein